MRLKSYYSATVESAIRLAHIELGEEAVFLGARRNDVGSDPAQAYEVSFAVMEAADSPATAKRAPQTQRSPARAQPAKPSRLNGATQQPLASAGTARGAAVTPDSGALLSWKKFLRHVSPSGARAALSEAAATDRDSGTATTAADGPAVHSTAARAAVRSGPSRAVSLPHWKEFVPGEERRRETAATGLFSGAEPLLGAEAPLETTTSPAVAEAANPPSGAAARTAPSAHLGSGPLAAAAAAPASEKTVTSRGAAPEPKTASGYSIERLGAELEHLRRMFESQQESRGARPPSLESLGDPKLAQLYRGLIANALEPWLAAELVGCLRQAATEGADNRRLAALLTREIRGRFQANSELGCGGPRAVVALVGPAGAGKTTAAAKLAFRCGLLRRRKVRLFSVDQLRIGAVEPLQAYADLMNTPLQIVDEFDKLGAALGSPETGNERELLLIDTPGYGRREWDRARRTAAALSALGDVDVHLVLDLRTKAVDLRRAVEAFGVFRPAKLLFSRLDETSTFGTMLNETVRTGLPVSYVSVGQRVPEDIVPAGEPELLRLLFKDRS